MTKKITLTLTSRQEEWLKRTVKFEYNNLRDCVSQMEDYPAIKESLEIDKNDAKTVLEELGYDMGDEK